jgi:hypothetical protein
VHEMIVIEISSPVYDEEAGSEQLRWRTTVKAKRRGIEIQGDHELVAGGDLPVRDMRTGKQLLAHDDPEGWARNLPHAFRAGDLVVEIVFDDSEPVNVPVVTPKRDRLPSLPASLTDGGFAAHPSC